MVNDFIIRTHDIIPTYFLLENINFNLGQSIIKISGYLLHMLEKIYGSPYKFNLKINLITIQFNGNPVIEVDKKDYRIFYKEREKIIYNILINNFYDDIIKYIIYPFINEIYEDTLTLFGKYIYLDNEKRKQIAQSSISDKITDFKEFTYDINNKSNIIIDISNKKIKKVFFMFMDGIIPKSLLKNFFIDNKNINYVKKDHVYQVDLNKNNNNKNIEINYDNLKLESKESKLYIAFEIDNYITYQDGFCRLNF